MRGIGNDRGAKLPADLKGLVSFPGKSPIATCDVHRKIWVDNATGLRLSGEADSLSAAHAEVCEFWPSDLAKLFQAAGVPRAGPPRIAEGTRTPSVASGKNVASGPCIVSPKKGLIYHVRVGAQSDEVLNLEATAETTREHLHWFVDSAYVGVSEPSAALLWKPQPGHHVIRAVDDSGRRRLAADYRDVGGVGSRRTPCDDGEQTHFQYAPSHGVRRLLWEPLGKSVEIKRNCSW